MTLSLLVLAACDGGVPLESVPSESARVLCDTIVSCLGPLADRIGSGSDVCRADVEATFENGVLPPLQEAIDAGTVIYDPSRAAACLEEQCALGCDLLIAPAPQSCRDAFEGTLAEGEPCSISEECAGDAYCANAACESGVRGTCTARKASGSACASGDECQAGLVCENAVCRTPSSRSGGSCGGTTGLGCPLDEVCVGASDDRPGTCTPRAEVFAAALGEPCDILAQELCTPDLSCAVTGVEAMAPVMTCVAIAEPGGSCFLAVPEMCPEGQYCDADLAMGRLEGTCQPRPGEGQPCAGSSVCAEGLECIGGTCRALRDNGEACETGEECYSGLCDGGTCAPLPLCT